MLVTGVIFIILAVIMRHFLARRAFYRRNDAGIEEFKNYTSAAVTHFFEKIGYLLAGILMLLGILLIIASLMTGNS